MPEVERSEIPPISYKFPERHVSPGEYINPFPDQTVIDRFLREEYRLLEADVSIKEGQSIRVNAEPVNPKQLGFHIFERFITCDWGVEWITPFKDDTGILVTPGPGSTLWTRWPIVIQIWTTEDNPAKLDVDAVVSFPKRKVQMRGGHENHWFHFPRDDGKTTGTILLPRKPEIINDLQVGFLPAEDKPIPESQSR